MKYMKSAIDSFLSGIEEIGFQTNIFKILENFRTTWKKFMAFWPAKPQKTAQPGGWYTQTNVLSTLLYGFIIDSFLGGTQPIPFQKTFLKFPENLEQFLKEIMAFYASKR